MAVQTNMIWLSLSTHMIYGSKCPPRCLLSGIIVSITKPTKGYDENGKQRSKTQLLISQCLPQNSQSLLPLPRTANQIGNPAQTPITLTGPNRLCQVTCMEKAPIKYCRCYSTQRANTGRSGLAASTAA